MRTASTVTPPPITTSATAANRTRNREADWSRVLRWRSARRALWRLLDRHVAPGASVAVIGAGNAHDLPLRRLRRRAGRLDLIDIDETALRRARRREGIKLIAQDVTAGRADAIVRGAAQDLAPIPPLEAHYDVVVCDLFFTQLLYPALLDAGLADDTIADVLQRHGQALTDEVVAALHASASCVIHVHDVLGWWAGHPQPFPISDVLARAQRDPVAALELARRGNVPLGCDPRSASLRAGAEIAETGFWPWRFSPGVEYLVCATVTRSAGVSRTRSGR